MKMFFLFAKKVTLVNTNSKKELKEKEEKLRAAGIRVNTWATEELPVMGGAHMKSADWQHLGDRNKDDQRIVYHLEVAAKDQYRAIELLLGGAEPPEGFIP
ncbi:hypothetical protein [Lachnoclostridium sp. Marseille-P6806]|uniref:hypothetical protein n=1 Tax=Lachnoclostridium sp. Marseille-P6806 TaxID=2364793 RepID=UPI001031A9C8|nr:hypothetical protein [Lachnoclostridium sp. Marseille-P6806]